MVFGAFEVPDTPEARRNYIATSIPGEIWREFSGGEILRALQKFGLGITEGEFYKIRAEVAARERFNADVRRLDADTLMPASYFVEGHGLQLNTDFVYRFEVEITDPETGESYFAVRQLGSDEHLTVGEAMAQMVDTLEEGGGSPEGEVQGIVPITPLARPGSFIT